LLSNALPCPDVCLGEGRTRNSRQHQRSYSRVALGGRSEGQFPGPRSETTRNSRLGLARGAACQHFRQGCGEGLLESGMAGNRPGRKPSRNVETRTSCQSFRSPAQRVVGGYSSCPHPPCRSDCRGISGAALSWACQPQNELELQGAGCAVL
jgi:hypothetical protein